jgi:HSP20 family molecular chaperone IbpA
MTNYKFSDPYVADIYKNLVKLYGLDANHYAPFKKVKDALVLNLGVLGCDADDIKVSVHKRGIVNVELKEDGEYTAKFKKEFDLRQFDLEFDIKNTSKDVTNGVLSVRVPIVNDEIYEIE